MSSPALDMRDIVKKFGANTAVDRVGLRVAAGEVRALLGENGAGKSTLVNCLFGLQTPDEGEILLGGERVDIRNPRDAARLGVGMVHQHFKLVPSLTVAENVFLGREPGAAGFVSQGRAIREVDALSARFSLGIDARRRVGSLSVGAQQRVEILRALSTDVRVLVLDEPTAVLTPGEVEAFFEVVRSLADQGIAVVLISHHLEEVRRIADTVSVLRRGALVADGPASDFDSRDLARLIIGEDRQLLGNVPPGAPGKPILQVTGLQVRDDRGGLAVQGVSFVVHAGESVGILGISGNGQSELVEAITGLRRPVEGDIRIGDASVVADPGGARRAGLAHVPEDRIARGMCSSWTVEENITADGLRSLSLGRRLIRRADRRRRARSRMDSFDVRASSVEQAAGRLSGGNAQKMVLARELDGAPTLVVCAEPTRGLDIAASDFVRRELISQRDRGAALLLVSSEIGEVLDLSDRVLVILNGRIVTEISGRRPSEDEVGHAMLGEVA